MFFIKNVFLFVIVILSSQEVTSTSVLVSEGESSELQVQVVLPESLMEKLDGFEFVLDSYKNIVVKIEDPSTKDTSKLKNIIDEMRHSYQKYGLYVSIPVMHGEFANKLEKLGFKLHDIDTKSKKIFYLYNNGRDIPELNYAYTAAAVYIIRTNPETAEKELLLINERHKIVANIVGGISNKGESPEETAIREVREEVGLNIDKQNLKLIAVFHTVRADKKSCIEFLYVCDTFSGELKADKDEVLQCAWVPMSQILGEADTKVFGKSFHSLWKKVLKGTFRYQKNGVHITKTKKAYQVFNYID